MGVVVAPALASDVDHGDQVVIENPVEHTPHVMRPPGLPAGAPNPSVDAIVQVGNTIIAGGSGVEWVSPAGTYDNRDDDVAVNGIFAFNASTGVIDPTFDPGFADGAEVRALATDGVSVYVGGQFRVGTTAQRRLVKLTVTGQVDPTFQALPVDGAVNDLAVHNQRLYVGGPFTQITHGATTSNRSALAALDTVTGEVLSGVNVPFQGFYDASRPDPGRTAIRQLDVSPNGQKVVAVGNFATVGGQPRVQVAVVDTNLGGTGVASVATWATNRFDKTRNSCDPDLDSWVRDVDFSPDGSYFVVTTSGGFAGAAQSKTLCDSTTRWETASTGNGPSWIAYSGGDTLMGVAVTGPAVYVGGHPRWQNNPFGGGTGVRGRGAVERWGIAALDPLNGLPLSWNPGKQRGVGAQALYATSDGLWVGSDTAEIFGNVVTQPNGDQELEGETHARLAFLPLAGGDTVPEVGPAVLPNNLFVAGGNALTVLKRRPVDAEGRPAGGVTDANTTVDWSTIRGAFLIHASDGSRTLYYGSADGNLYRRSFDPATGAVGAQQAVNLYDGPDGRRIPFPIARLTGMFFDPAEHRLYYSVAGDANLYFRYFTPESRIVGAQTFTARRGGVNFAGVRGMTFASGKIIYGSTDGKSRSVTFGDGRVTGSPVVLSTGTTWNYRAIFVDNE